jgi:hypothetical protein
MSLRATWGMGKFTLSTRRLVNLVLSVMGI